MLTATTFDMGFPANWNAAVLEIRRAEACDKPRISFDKLRSGFYLPGNAVTPMPAVELTIASLGWTPAEALETYLRLRTFAEDWDAPGMEAYDRKDTYEDRVLTEFKPGTELGKRLLALRRAYIERGGRVLDEAALAAELRERRGGVQDD